MRRRSRFSSLAAWAAIGALALKAALPLLAAGAADLRGVAVAEVCPLYGVAMPAAAAPMAMPVAVAPMAGDPHAHHPHHHAADADRAGAMSGSHATPPGDHEAPAGPHFDSHRDHCALSALAALAVPDISPLGLAPPTVAIADSTSRPFATPRDAAARWAARLRHGPPAHA
jgi:hypothetical protein